MNHMKSFGGTGTQAVTTVTDSALRLCAHGDGGERHTMFLSVFNVPRIQISIKSEYK